MDGLNLLNILKFVAVLVAAAIIGNWFLARVKKPKIREDPWYMPYVSLPGIIILLALMLPLILWIINR